MDEKLDKDIKRFIDYFKKQVDEIESLHSEHSELYRRLLYASLLDTLAGTVYSKRLNRERFVGFIKRFCRWSDGDRISLSHLVQLLRKNPDPVYEKLRIWTLGKFKSLPVHGSQLMPISHEPKFEEVQKIWPVQKDHRTPIVGIDLVSLQHYQLLYYYRNVLIHELRVPGYGMEFGDGDEDPYYHLMSTIGDNNELLPRSVELVYPWRFLKKLCNTALGELEKYYTENEINPRDSFSFGTYWIGELNK